LLVISFGVSPIFLKFRKPTRLTALPGVSHNPLGVGSVLEV
jgi:hypothetical protein